MSAPIPALLLPYEVRYVPVAGDSQLQVIPTQRNSGGTYSHRLQPGSYRVQLSWDGPDSVSLRRSRSSGAWLPLESIPAGVDGVPRSGRSHVLSVVSATGVIAILPVAASAALAASGATATLSVYPMEPYVP